MAAYKARCGGAGWIVSQVPFFYEAMLVLGSFRCFLGGGFKYCLFSALLGEDFHFD